jgi:hypothetical protein
MIEFNEENTGEIFTWKEINQIHRSYNGIYQRRGKLISLLTDFGKINPCYPDFEGDDPDTIFYTGAGRRGDQKLDVKNQAMHTAIKTQRSFPLFCKIAVDQWKFMGSWRVIDAEYIYEEKNQRNVWSFVLKKVKIGNW